MADALLSLHVDVGLKLGEFELGVALEVGDNRVTAVLGPNGAGKSTLLRCIGGSLAVDRGSIRLGERVLDEPPRTFVPPAQRRVGIVHQDYLLFPHLSVLENVAFGVRAQGRSAVAARHAATELLERMDLAKHARSKPSALSGGQAQRVALARALANDPDALLLDEPLAALDATTRIEVRRELRRHLEGFAGPTVLVSHDPVDALALADDVAILEAGRLTQVGTMADVAAFPRSRYVADLIGTNLVTGVANGGTIETDRGFAVSIAEPRQGAVFATISPAAIALHRNEPEGSPRNRWLTSVSHVDLLGDRVRVRLAEPLGLTAEVTPGAIAELGLAEGDPVWASVKATEIVSYPA